MRELNIEDITYQLHRAPQLPRLNPSPDRARSTELPQTRAVIQAAQLTAQAELERIGLSTEHGNPLDRILAPGHRHPFVRRLNDAITAASTANAFGNNTSPPADVDTWRAGMRVELVQRPVDNHLVGLPTTVTVGSEGTLVEPERYHDTDGWRVRFEIHGTWWTPTYTLELL